MSRAPHDDDTQYEFVPSVSIGEIANTLRRYRHVLLLSLVVTSCLLVIAGLALWLAMPARHITSLPFQLEFEGAEVGRFPNGTPFSAQEVVAAPVLLTVFRANSLEDVMSFQEFRDSVFVLESNTALDKLSREYRAKLADPKLSPVDRDRLEREFQEKRESLAKDSYSINYISEDRTTELPRSVRAKILQDILQTWARYSVEKKGVALYDLSILSSAIFDRQSLAANDYVIALDMLRTNIERVIKTIDQMENLPGAKVARTPQDRLSLAELRVRLEDAIKFRVQPLVGMILSEGLSRNPAASITFLESRLRFNELEQHEAESRVAALRDAITTYLQPQSGREAGEASSGDSRIQGVMPLLDKSFLDRMLAMSGEQEDLLYRQKLVDRMREDALAVVPLEAEANYYRSLLGELRDGRTQTRPANRDETRLIEGEVNGIIQEAISVTKSVNQLYLEISKGLTPSTLLYSATVPPTSIVERTLSLSRLALLGVLLVFLSLAGTVLGILLHARITRDEEPREVIETHNPRTAVSVAAERS